ncbi:flagellar hook capping FlgD N-terminal domain-containing protein [Frigidibacter sp. MR17.14]|uniref:flagellar hook capping FlgD N-terminal domain-containing protein n=1 Tax=Frigidibacter sp. MR17.14 TaxID=3126509 RepID=UPI003012CFEE
MAVTAVASATPSSSTQPSSAEDATDVSSDFQTFLTMLTTQLQNQDPLNPMESTDFAVQLATFSGVEQQVKTNDLLTDLGSRLNVMALSDLVGWVGLQAEASGPVWFDGAPVELGLTPSTVAEAERLSVYNASNQLVAQAAVPLGTTQLDWAGTDANGNPLPEGAYHFKLDHLEAGIVTGSSEVTSFSPIIEARNEGGSVILLRKGGISVPAADVTALRSAQ